MIIRCEHCGTRFKVPDDKVSPRGTKVRCSKCKHVFVVRKGQADGDRGTTSAGISAQARSSTMPTGAPVQGRRGTMPTGAPVQGRRGTAPGLAQSVTPPPQAPLAPPRGHGPLAGSNVGEPLAAQSSGPAHGQGFLDGPLAGPDPGQADRSGGLGGGDELRIETFASDRTPSFRPKAEEPVDKKRPLLNAGALADSGAGQMGRMIDFDSGDGEEGGPPPIGGPDSAGGPGFGDLPSLGGPPPDQPQQEQSTIGGPGFGDLPDLGGGPPPDKLQQEPGISLAGAVTERAPEPGPAKDGTKSPFTGSKVEIKEKRTGSLAESRSTSSPFPFSVDEAEGARPSLSQELLPTAGTSLPAMGATAVVAPKAKTPFGITALTTIVSFLVLLDLFAGFAAFKNNWILDLRDPKKALAIAFGQRGPDKTIDAGPLVLTDLRQTLYTTRKGKDIFLVEGTAVNTGPLPIRKARVTVRLVDQATGKAVDSIEVPVGAWLSPESLDALDGRDGVKAAYLAMERKKGFGRVPRNGRAPFMAVFTGLPKEFDASRHAFDVRVTDVREVKDAGGP